MRPKKSLGQNFLKSKEALRLIIEAGDLKPDDTVLEIGPGKGVLTAELLAKSGKVIAVETDGELIELLKEKFTWEISAGKLELIHGDILTLDIRHRLADLGISKYKLIANIPYYITGAILKKFLEGPATEDSEATPFLQPERMVLLVQKEVALRIVAKDKKESILSISVKAYGKPRYVKTVQAKYFSPEPNVDSAILSIENISKNFFLTNKASGALSEKKFFEVVKTGFAHKRKMAKGNLGQKYKNLDEVFQKLGINLKARAEDIDVETWKKITEKTI